MEPIEKPKCPFHKVFAVEVSRETEIRKVIRRMKCPYKSCMWGYDEDITDKMMQEFRG